MTIYPALAVRTDFSLGESVITSEDLVKLAELAGTHVVGVCDTMNVCSLIPATKALNKAEKRLLLGVRVRVTDNADKTDIEEYLTLYPTDEIGMQALYRLVSRGYEADRFYYHARVTWDDIAAVGDTDHLVMVTGDAQSVIQRVGARDRLAALLSATSFSKVFISLVPYASPYWDSHNKKAMQIYTALNGAGFEVDLLTLVPTLTLPDTEAVFSINASVAEKRPYADYLKPVHSFSPVTQKELVMLCVAAAARFGKRWPTEDVPMFKQGLENTQSLVDMCGYNWQKSEPSLPVVAANPVQEMVEACKKGWVDRFSRCVFAHQPTKKELEELYKPRLQFEIETLARLNFAGYFLLVSDLVRWSKENDILVGPGRGSVGGSLVAYLMGITDVDPIRFNLLFERFINPDRLDLPDADLDFMSTRREEIIDYLTNKYGAENVAGIANYNTMASKSSVKDAGRILGVPQDRLDAMKFMPELHGQSVSLEEAVTIVPQIAALAGDYPVLWSSALALEGKMRSYGRHAAGVVVAGEPLTKRAVVMTREGSPSINWDKVVSEDQGLVKLDVLGLSTLDTFGQAVKLIRERHSVDLDLLNIPLDDEKTLRLFSEGKTLGIFQFEGGGARRLLKEMADSGLLTFDDLAALNALNRPGPLDAGLAKSYIDRRNGRESVTYLHPKMEEALKDTYGVLVYQEELMRVSRDLCGFTPGEADKLRKAVGKKDPVLMASMKDKFIDGADKFGGMDRKLAESFWQDVAGFAAYSFNKSHSVAYSLIGYQAAYMKAHYCVEFYTAAMSVVVDDSDKLGPLVAQAAKDGIRVIPPDINIATDNFVILNDTTVMAPLSAVKNVSSTSARAVVEARNSSIEIEESTGRGKAKVTTKRTLGPGRFESIADLQLRVPAKKLNSRGIDHLNKVGAFARIEEGQSGMLHPDRKRDQIELMPGVMEQSVAATRGIEMQPEVFDAVDEIVADYRKEADIQSLLPPYIGSRARFMVVQDMPTAWEEKIGFLQSKPFIEYVMPALRAAGLDREDAFWTMLCRRPKMDGEREIPRSELAQWQPYLEREIELLKPPVIVVIGNAAARALCPDIKGSMEDHIGKAIYNAKLDATIIIGFNPGSIFHKPARQDTLAEIFAKASELISTH